MANTLSERRDVTAGPVAIAAPATREDLPRIAALFNDYRAFYGAPEMPDEAARFLQQNVEQGRALLFASHLEGELAGFAQVYTTWCSLEMAPVFILHDLFTAPERRGRGVARALLARVVAEGAQRGAIRVDLMTADDNHAAKRLYESTGWVRERVFHTYSRSTASPLAGEGCA